MSRRPALLLRVGALASMALLSMVAGCESSGETTGDPDAVGTADVAAPDATGDASPTPDVSETPDTAPEIVDTPDPITGPLAHCDGPAMIHVAAELGDAVETVRWPGGDLIVRGTATACGEDGDVERLQLRATCGGPLSLTLGWKQLSSELSLSVRADEVDGGSLAEPMGAGTKFANLQLSEVVDADESGDYALDIEIRCVSGKPTPWTLLLDSTSTQHVPTADNGWPINLRPDEPASCATGHFADLPPLIDQLGNSDVDLGQFYGDMVLVVFSGTWCVPCQNFAAQAEALHEEVEALSDEWGFTVIELLIEDNFQKPTQAAQTVAWAEAFGVTSPVLGGPGSRPTDSCLSTYAIPTFAILDPHLGMREFSTQFVPATLRSSIQAHLNTFRLENPDWASPRCAGVEGAELLCPCAEQLPGEPDADGDNISDACDVCDQGNDRKDFDHDGVADACDATPGQLGPPKYLDVGSVQWLFRAEVRGDGTLKGGTWSDQPANLVQAVLYDDSGHQICFIQRVISADQPSMDSDEPDFLLGWQFGPGAGTLTRSTCEGLLDPAVWGTLPEATIANVPWRLSLLSRCPVEGCAGQDDPIWAEEASKGYPACSLEAEVCEGGMIGATASFGTNGTMRAASGESPGTALLYPESSGTTPYDVSTLVPSSTVVKKTPAGLYWVSMTQTGDDIAELLTGKK